MVRGRYFLPGCFVTCPVQGRPRFLVFRLSDCYFLVVLLLQCRFRSRCLLSLNWSPSVPLVQESKERM